MVDKVLFVSHIVLILVAFAAAGMATKSKMNTHNQCYLKAKYRSDGSIVSMGLII